jgi:hypothetical protein
MDFFTVPILFGNNRDTLFGIENDIYIIYNLFYKFFLKDPNSYNIPFYFINKQCIFNNLKEILNIKSNKKIIFLIYFSGHASSNGSLKFYNEKIKVNFILDYFNKNLKYLFHVYFIIDACYSKKFILNMNTEFKYIEKIYFIGSSNSNETSKEIEVSYDETLFNHMDIKPCKNMIVGIFTLYFVKLIEGRNIDNIIDFKNIINDKLWKMISNKYNQTLYYDEIIF